MSPTDNTDVQDLAQRLREAREFLNLSQQFVAEQTNISRSSISDIERSERKVESLELKRLAELYRMPVDYFLGNDPSDYLPEGEADPTVQALARAASEMGPAEKQQVLRFALFLSNYKGAGEQP